MGCFKSKDRQREDAKLPLVPRQLGADIVKARRYSGTKRDLGSRRKSKPIVREFTLKELAVATNDFTPESFLGEGGFGRVYKGHLESTGQLVAVKQLDENGPQGNKEFDVEVLLLRSLHHPNLVNLIGHCADGVQRLLVYEFMPLGSLEDHLHDLPPNKEPLDWTTRMKIAAGAAKGLQYLHDIAYPPIIHRDLKPSNILLGEGFHPKLSDFGLAKHGPTGEKTHVTTRVMGTEGYCAPEYYVTGRLTPMSDLYSFGVVFLELITGRRAVEITEDHREVQLVSWARPMLNKPTNFNMLVDPKLQGKYPRYALCQALHVASSCISPEAKNRPRIADVVSSVSYLASRSYDLNDKVRSHGGNRRRLPAKHELHKDRRLALAEAKLWGESARK